MRPKWHGTLGTRSQKLLTYEPVEGSLLPRTLALQLWGEPGFSLRVRLFLNFAFHIPLCSCACRVRSERGCAGPPLLGLGRGKIFAFTFWRGGTGEWIPVHTEGSDPAGKLPKAPESVCRVPQVALALGWAYSRLRCVSPRSPASLAGPAACWAGRGCKRPPNTTDLAVREGAKSDFPLSSIPGGL